MISTEKLKEARKERGFSQEYMATELGFSGKSGYNMLENGNIQVSLERAKKISEILEKTIEELFFETEVQESKTKR